MWVTTIINYYVGSQEADHLESIDIYLTQRMLQFCNFGKIIIKLI